MGVYKWELSLPTTDNVNKWCDSNLLTFIRDSYSLIWILIDTQFRWNYFGGPWEIYNPMFNIYDREHVALLVYDSFVVSSNHTGLKLHSVVIFGNIFYILNT